MSLTPDDRAFVRDLAVRRAAIVLEAGKDYLIDTRLEALARSDGFADGAAVVAAARRAPHGPVPDRIVEAMTTNETSFFRDRTPFDVLRDHVLPGLIAARATTRRLRIWCGASSSGQEPYSIAMVLMDRFPELRGWDVRIVGTDVSAEMVARARDGVYSQMEVGRGMPTPMLVRFFEQQGTRWKVRPEVRDLVTFAEFNLIGTWPPPVPTPDVVFLRNVMIYFDATAKQSILRNVERILAPDGALFLGAGESVVNSGTSLVREDHGASSCYRLGGAPAPVATTPTAAPAAAPAVRAPIGAIGATRPPLGTVPRISPAATTPVAPTLGGSR